MAKKDRSGDRSFRPFACPYLAQSVLPLYFGLGEATKIDHVEVDWPSGKKQVVNTGLSENQTIEITEPK